LAVSQVSTFKQLRILFLLLILLTVAVGTWLTKLRTTSWERPLVVAIYPINGDGSAQAAAYIKDLSVESFDDIERFFASEAEQYRLALKQPVDIVLGPVLTESPPPPPKDRNVLGVMWWSLKIRWWAWRVGREQGPPANIQIFVLYHDPKLTPRVAHSLGLQKGLLGVVHAFASSREEPGNNIVIAHELLHTVGATDKYDPRTDQPLYPIGYAEPDKEPVLPQEFAEIMAGRVPLSPTTMRQARDLSEELIGEYTALEIRWID
jgi:hypothetical protein